METRSRNSLAQSIFIMILGTILFAVLARALIHEQPPAEEPFTYSFHVDGTLEESGSARESGSEYWWLSSGGHMTIANGVGKTIQGALPATDAWRRAYARSSAADTHSGRYPQNLFRLVTQRAWENVRIEARFRIVKDNEVRSPNRNESNGLLLMSRYHNDDNLYYSGLRVDGHAVIKKKSGGVYTTLAEKPVYSGEYDGDNLLPHDTWIAVRSETKTIENGVEVVLSMQNEAGEWRELLRAIDTRSPITGEGSVGLRTDFMDVEFDDFKADRI